MSDLAQRRASRPPKESDLSQVLAHGPACREAYGRFWGGIIMIVAISKTRTGALGVAAVVGAVGTVGSLIYKVYLH